MPDAAAVSMPTAQNVALPPALPARDLAAQNAPLPGFAGMLALAIGPSMPTATEPGASGMSAEASPMPARASPAPPPTGPIPSAPVASEPVSPAASPVPISATALRAARIAVGKGDQVSQSPAPSTTPAISADAAGAEDVVEPPDPRPPQEVAPLPAAMQATLAEPPVQQPPAHPAAGTPRGSQDTAHGGFVRAAGRAATTAIARPVASADLLQLPLVTPGPAALPPMSAPAASSVPEAPPAENAPTPASRRAAPADVPSPAAPTSSPPAMPERHVLAASGVAPEAPDRTTAPQPEAPMPPMLAASATPPAAAPEPSPPATAVTPTPATQIAPALVSLAHAPDGSPRLTLRLQPPELGQVQVRIDRPTDAPPRVEITVQRSETLTLLLRDQPQLQRALDQAGLPVDGRSLTFHVAPPPPNTTTSGGQMTLDSGASSGGGGGGYASDSGLQPGDAVTNDDTEPPAEAVPIVLQHWLRAGLDITA